MKSPRLKRYFLLLLLAVFLVSAGVSFFKLRVSRPRNTEGTSSQEGAVSLSRAAENGFENMMRLALARGADPNVTDTDGYTLLHYAARGNRANIAGMLLATGAKINPRTNRGWTPLHIAAALGNVPVANTLLMYGADVNTLDLTGLTPLHHAASGRNPAMVSLLLSKGADPRITDCLGWTPAQHAAYEGTASIIELLPVTASFTERVGKAPVAKTVRPPKQYARPQRQSGGQPPNILLITIDALRADRLHCYGYRRKTSPILDQLAEEGTLFLDTTSVGATTVNTVPTLLTGQHPGENGLVWREQQGQLSPKPEDSCPTIAEMLLEHGYATGLVTSNPLVGEPMGLAKGFDVLDLSPSEGNVWLYSQAKYINTRALEWLDQLDQKQPFFLYLHYLEPHNQYRPPSEFCVFGRPGYTARDDAVNNTANLLQDKVEPPITDADLRKDDLSIQDITRLRDLYDNEILCVDHYLGQLFDQLKQLDRFDNTIIVLTADHGEAFLEHGYLEHDKSLYQEMVHIPLLIRGPGVPAGRRSKAVVSQADIVPTLLDLLGITPAVKMSGATLRPLLNNETTAPTSLALTQIPSQKTSALRQGSLKLIVTGSNKELYDLSRDPGEKTNLAAKEAEKVRQLSGILDATLAKQTIRRSQQASPSPSHDRALRSLGYLR